jgi:hypothetical protein
MPQPDAGLGQVRRASGRKQDLADVEKLESQLKGKRP